MERKKIPVYILGILVMSIWGMILYRISSSTAQVDEALGRTTENGSHKAQVPVIQPDTFRLLMNYPDPFEENSNEKTAPAAQAIKKASALGIQTIPQLKVQQPAKLIRYIGYIRNDRAKKRIALLNKEGKDHFMEEGAFFDQMKLISVLKDSIKISYRGKTTFIRREK